MKKTPYIEIVDMEAERNEYSLLCRGKSKKYSLYSDWEEHMTECLSRFETYKDLYNFKRFCINSERTSTKAPDMFISYVALLLTVCLDILFEGLNSWLLVIMLLALLAYTIYQNKILIRESFFYQDVIEIIDKLEGTYELS